MNPEGFLRAIPGVPGGVALAHTGAQNVVFAHIVVDNRTMTIRRDTLGDFRTRVESLRRERGLTRSAFAALAGVDRSTLSQLLSTANRRLPRVETLVALATASNVSVDWLLGLTNDGRASMELMTEQASIHSDVMSPDDERLVGWLAEAVGTKIRYIPTTLPDLLKTEDVIRHETYHYAAANPRQRIDTAAVKLEWQRRPETDMEACNSLQAVEGFVAGEGIWRSLSATRRRAQVDHMIDLVDELYPTFRWFLYDGRERYAAPVTIFGSQRAAIYLGQMYLVLHGADHVRQLAVNFDQLLRHAVVQPTDVGKLLVRLRSKIAD